MGGLRQAQIASPPSGEAGHGVPGPSGGRCIVTQYGIEGAYVVTNDGARSEHDGGHVVVEDNLIVAVGPGPAADGAPGAAGRRLRLLVIPGSSTPTTTSTNG